MATDDGDETALPLEESAIDADLHRTADAIDISGADAAANVWRAFIEHAGRPLAFGSTFREHPDNDQLWFEAGTGRGGIAVVTLERRIGVVHRQEGYWGTIAALYGLKLAGGGQWSTVGDCHIEGYGVTSGGLGDFRREVEASDAFAALLASRITELTLLASYT